MASSTAPYDASMRLGMGFNSFTQELCLADAIVKTASSQKKDQRNASPSVEHGGSNVKVSKQKVLEANAALDQQVHSTVKFVSRYSELVDALGVSAASQIQHARGHYAAFLNVDNFNDHHVDYLIRVVASRPVPCSELTELDIIPNLPKEEFSKIYGDSFISGFNEGGEFVALISVKLADPSHANIAAVKRQLEETMDLTFRVGSETVAPDSRPLVLEGEFKTVVQRRGGQISEAPSKWTLRDIREEAMAFAKHAFAYPVRLSPILTKYTTLRSFHVAKMQHAFVVPEYDRHGANVHAEALLDAYVEYRAVAREIQHAEWEVAHGLSSLTVQTATDDLAQLSAQAQANYEAWLGRKEESAAPPSTPPKWFNTLSPYHASIIGLSKARQDCQDEIIRILDELDAVTADPELAAASSSFWEYGTPMLLRSLLPTVNDLRKEQIEVQRAQALEALTRESGELKQRLEEKDQGIEELKVAKNLLQERVSALDRQVAPYDGWCSVPLGQPVRLVNVSSGKSMDYSYNYGNSLHQWDSGATNSNQKFEVVVGDSKGYFIRHCDSGRYLNPARSGDIGVYMEFSDFPGSFTFEGLEKDGIVMIHFAEQPHFTLNIEKNSRENGVKIIGWSKQKGICDQWRVSMY